MNRSTLLFGALLMLAFVATAAHAEWITVNGNLNRDDDVALHAQGSSTTIIQYRMPGFELESVEVAGRSCSRIHLPGQVSHLQAGYPELPRVTVTLAIAPRGIPKLRILTSDVIELSTAPVEPSRGHLTRDVDPASVVPAFGPVYDGTEIWPAQAAELADPFILRDQRGVSLVIHPFRWNNERQILEVIRSIEVELTLADGIGLNELESTLNPVDEAFTTIYSELFANYRVGEPAAKYLAPPPVGRMLLVTDGAFVNALQPFMEWKRRRGIDVDLVTVAAAGGTAAGVAQAIAERYAEPASLTWVVLVGDRQQVPTLSGLYDGSDSDSRYAMVAGNDLYPDLYISRISATNSTQVQTQVAKFVAYERDPASGAGAAWYSRGAGIASDEGSPTDFARADLLRDDLLAYSFTGVDQIYQGLGGTTAGITTALNEGRSLINYLGHGSGTSWTSVTFGTAQIHALTNSGRLPWIVDVSCSNGNFALGECFAEAWLRAGTPGDPRGAVGMMSATSLAPWVPPTLMQAEVVDLLTRDAENTLGALYYSGLMRVLDEYAGVPVARQVVEQNVIFGDCSLMVRTSAPGQYQVVDTPVIEPGSEALSLIVAGGPHATVAVTSGEDLLGSGVTDSEGRVVIALAVPLAEGAIVDFTITGYNMVPYLGTVTVQSAVAAAGDLLPPDRLVLYDNYPNPFNPSTTLSFELAEATNVRLAIYDIRGRVVSVLHEGMLQAGRQEVVWGGCNGAGQAAPSGVYLYRLESAAGSRTGRMVLGK